MSERRRKSRVDAAMEWAAQPIGRPTMSDPATGSAGNTSSHPELFTHTDPGREPDGITGDGEYVWEVEVYWYCVPYSNDRAVDPCVEGETCTDEGCHWAVDA